MQNLFKEFFYFSREEKRGILTLMGCIGIVLLSGYIISAWQRKVTSTEEEQAAQNASLKEYETFIASIKEDKAAWNKHYSYNHRWKEQIPIVLAPFNPNSADSLTFRRLGLPAWMTKNILRYRSKGGKFRKTDDFKKVYGLTDEQYATLSPYIYIAPEDTMRNIPELYIRNDKTAVANEAVGTENPQTPYKYPAGTILDLNHADTTELKKIPGIGSGIARMIVRYREQLGGFYEIGQLKEIHLDANQLQSWFSIQTQDNRRINLNRVSIERLRSHPYINFYQAKAIVEYRKKKGTLNSLKPFTLYEEFSKSDLERISHYICFE